MTMTFADVISQPPLPLPDAWTADDATLAALSGWRLFTPAGSKLQNIERTDDTRSPFPTDLDAVLYLRTQKHPTRLERKALRLHDLSLRAPYLVEALCRN